MKKTDSRRDKEFVATMLKMSQDKNPTKAKALHDSVNIDEIKDLTKDILNNSPVKKRKF